MAKRRSKRSGVRKKPSRKASGGGSSSRPWLVGVVLFGLLVIVLLWQRPRQIENKAVVDGAVPVEITRIGRDGAVIVSAVALDLRGDIKLRVERDDGTWDEELYGKVISELGEHLPDESGRYRVAFTGRTRPADD